MGAAGGGVPARAGDCEPTVQDSLEAALPPVTRSTLLVSEGEHADSRLGVRVDDGVRETGEQEPQEAHHAAVPPEPTLGPIRTPSLAASQLGRQRRGREHAQVNAARRGDRQARTRTISSVRLYGFPTLVGVKTHWDVGRAVDLVPRETVEAIHDDPTVRVAKHLERKGKIGVRDLLPVT